jgi:putative DNA primase/helicase
MKETAEKFYDEDFLQHMNQDPTLVGFSNGVLELRHAGDDGAPHVHFRPGRPDDCISFQMGRGQVGLDAIPYLPYNPAAPAPEHLEVLDFFTKIYPDPILREYALTLFAACLEGANKEQKFYIMSGSGGNGKSKIIDLMSKTFGEYQESLPVTALTRKRADAGSANPELIVLKCKRFVSMVEPEEGERINTSLMKQLSGEDTLKARGLFQDQDQFVVMARIFMSCNDLPGVSSMDNGTWRRLRVIPHVATFVEPGKPTDSAAHIHSRDPLLDSKINRWRPYLAAILVWYYETKYLRGGLTEPVQVTAASMKYKEENDSFAAFCQECLIKEAGAEVKANDVLGRYKEWCRFNPGKKVLQRSAIISKMSELYGKPVDAAGRIFAGIRLAEEGEDLSGNAV